MLMLSRICFFMIGTNRLGKVTVGGSQKSYAYNADGTMKTDGLRGLNVTYNCLKLPKTVKKGTTSTVTYIYDANGNKLAVSQDGTAKNYYCGDFVYDGSLAVAYILTPNGQLTRNPTTGAYTSQYNIPDHLGNVRSMVSSSGTVLQSTDYYPFGLAFADADIASNRYLYNGKELEDYTLGTSYLGTLDYGARHYDPRIARWTVPDPMAEKYYGINPYVYCAGDPMNRIDDDGCADFWLNGKIIGNDGIDDQRVLVVRSDALTRSEIKETVNFIKSNSGHSSAFSKNGLAYANTIAIESSSDNRQAMVTEVTKDNGKGGTANSNNREYGGFIENGKIIVVNPGIITNPKSDIFPSILLPKGVPTFHSHPSGTLVESNSADVLGSTQTTYSYVQTPSQIDINTAETYTHYVFGRGSGEVYIYNSEGLQATIPMNRFVTPKAK